MGKFIVSPVTPTELPWSNCVLGCEIPAEGRIHLFPCLHVLCSDACLEKVFPRGSSAEPHQCSKCVRKFSFDQVKRNLKLEDFLKKKTNPEDVLKCGKCSWNNPAASYCTQCKAYLCSSCMEHHKRRSPYHELEEDVYLRMLIETEKQNLCSFHGNKPKKFFCLTCQVKICEGCKPRHHSETHQVVTVEKEMAKIHRRIDSTKEVRGKAKLAIAKLGKKLKSLKNAEWKEFVSGVDTLLAEAKEKLLDEGRKHRKMKEKRIRTKLKDLQDSSFLHEVNDLSKKLDLDDTWMINVASSSLPQSNSNNISFTRETLEENFDDFVEANQSLADVLPELQQSLFPRLGGSGVCSTSTPGRSSSPIPEPSSLMRNYANASPSSTLDEVSSNENQAEPVVVDRRRIACKSTGGKFSGRPLGMPHLNITRVTSLASNEHANPPSPRRALDPKKGERGHERKRKACGGDDGSDSDDIIVVDDFPKTTGKRVPLRQVKRAKRHHNQEEQPRSVKTSFTVSNASRCGRPRLGTTVENAASKKPLRRGRRSAASSPAFLNAPANSFHSMDDLDEKGEKWRWNCFPVHKHDQDDCSGNSCVICVEGGDFLCCESKSCNRVFHLKCCIPALKKAPKGIWRCNHHKTKEMIESELGRLRDMRDSQDQPLTNTNAKQFAMACYFMIAIHKIPERPTMQWYFPEEYLERFKKVPYHLDFIRRKLCLPTKRGMQKPFSCVQEYMEAFRQMFLQAFRIYKKGNKYHKDAIKFLEKFKQALEDYYPEHRDLFEDILED